MEETSGGTENIHFYDSQGSNYNVICYKPDQHIILNAHVQPHVNVDETQKIKKTVLTSGQKLLDVAWTKTILVAFTKEFTRIHYLSWTNCDWFSS